VKRIKNCSHKGPGPLLREIIIVRKNGVGVIEISSQEPLGQTNSDLMKTS
jgi:hypothetical protein